MSEEQRNYECDGKPLALLAGLQQWLRFCALRASASGVDDLGMDAASMFTVLLRRHPDWLAAAAAELHPHIDQEPTFRAVLEDAADTIVRAFPLPAVPA